MIFGGLLIPRPMVDDPDVEHEVERRRREWKERLRALELDEPLVDGEPPHQRTHYYGGPKCTHDDRTLLPEPPGPWLYARCNACGRWRTGSDPMWRPISESKPT